MCYDYCGSLCTNMAATVLPIPMPHAPCPTAPTCCSSLPSGSGVYFASLISVGLMTCFDQENVAEEMFWDFQA